MKVLLTIWISAVLIQEVIPSTLVRLPRQARNKSSLVDTEYEAKYEQKGKHGNESFSSISGKQQFMHDNCSENWNAFAEKCASLIKDLVASLANVVTSKPGDATNLQLQIKNTFRHFDNTLNCTCFNPTGKDFSDLDLSPLFNNITINTVGPAMNGVDGTGSGNNSPASNSNGGGNKGSGHNQSGKSCDESCDGGHNNAEKGTQGQTVGRPMGVPLEWRRTNPLVDAENLDVHPSTAGSSNDQLTNNNRRQAMYPQVSKQPETVISSTDVSDPYAADSQPSFSKNGKQILHPFLVTPRPVYENPNHYGIAQQPALTEIITPIKPVTENENQLPVPVINSHPSDPTVGYSKPESQNSKPAIAVAVEPVIKRQNSQPSFVAPTGPTSENFKTKPAVVVPVETTGYNSEPSVVVPLKNKDPSITIPVINSNSNLPESSVPEIEGVKSVNPSPIYQSIPTGPSPIPSSKVETGTNPEEDCSSTSNNENGSAGHQSGKPTSNQLNQGVVPISPIPVYPLNSPVVQPTSTLQNQPQGNGQVKGQEVLVVTPIPLETVSAAPVNGQYIADGTGNPNSGDDCSSANQQPYLLTTPIPTYPLKTISAIPAIVGQQYPTGNNMPETSGQQDSGEDCKNDEDPTGAKASHGATPTVFESVKPMAFPNSEAHTASSGPAGQSGLSSPSGLSSLGGLTNQPVQGTSPVILTPVQSGTPGLSDPLGQSEPPCPPEQSVQSGQGANPIVLTPVQSGSPGLSDPLGQSEPPCPPEQSVQSEQGTHPAVPIPVNLEHSAPPTVLASVNPVTFPNSEAHTGTSDTVGQSGSPGLSGSPTLSGSEQSETSETPCPPGQSVPLGQSNQSGQGANPVILTPVQSGSPGLSDPLGQSEPPCPPEQSVQSGQGANPVVLTPVQSGSLGLSDPLGQSEPPCPPEQSVQSGQGTHPAVLMPANLEHSAPPTVLESVNPIISPNNEAHTGSLDPAEQSGPLGPSEQCDPLEQSNQSGQGTNPVVLTPVPLGTPAVTEPVKPVAVVPTGEGLSGQAQPLGQSVQPVVTGPLGDSGQGAIPALVKPSQPESGAIPVISEPAKPAALIPVGNEQGAENPVLIRPTTFQTTSVEPTAPVPIPIKSPIPITHSSVPQDSYETFSVKPSTSSSTPVHHEDDDDDDCCSCESCTEDEITDPKQFRETACQNLEEARRELKRIFDKIKKKLKCGKKAPQTITSQPIS